MSASKAIALVVTLMVFGVVAAVMLPVAIDEIEGDTEVTLTQDNQTAYEVNSQLNSTVTAVVDSTSATVELNDTRTSGTTSNTINVGANETYSLEGGDVVVGVESASSGTPDTATVNYTHSNDYTYSEGSQSLWGLLGLAIVLTAVLFIIGEGLNVFNGMGR